MGSGRHLKVAILLGDRSLETLVRAKALGAATAAARPLGRDTTGLVFGLPDYGDRHWNEHAALLVDTLPGASIRRLAWERVRSQNARRMFQPLDLPIALQGIERVTLPRDWGANFLDCDAWLILADSRIGGVYPARPTAIFCSDLAQRRAPGAYAKTMDAPFWTEQTTAFRLWRQSAAVVASDPATAADLVSYAGVAPDRVIVLGTPLDCALPAQQAPLGKAVDRLLIRFEPDLRHACEKVLCGLCQYRSEGGALRPVIASETVPEALGRTSNLPEIAYLPHSVRDMLDDARAERVETPADWARLLAQHARCWLPREHGGDGQAVRQALRSGLQVLCADTPLARAAHEHTEGAITFYRARSASEVADALHAFEATSPEKPAKVAPHRIDGHQLAIEVGFVLDRLQESAHA